MISSGIVKSAYINIYANKTMSKYALLRCHNSGHNCTPSPSISNKRKIMIMKPSSRMRFKFKRLKYTDIINRKLLKTIKVRSVLNHLRCNITFQQLQIDHQLLYYCKDNLLLLFTYLIQYIVVTKYSIYNT